MQQLLSIITINFNDVLGLEKTVNSVENQTYTNFEYIIIDGGSKDGSCEYLNKKKQLFSYLISEKDSGIYNAMNKGIKVAKGEYLLFLNSGDILNGVNALQDFIDNSNFSGDIIYGDYKFLDGGKKYPDVLTPLHFFKSSLPHQSSFIKRDLFSKFGLYDERFKIVSDKSFYIKCFLSEKVVFKHINQKLAIIDLHGISNNIAFKKNVQIENSIILKEHFGVFYLDYKNMLELKSEYKNLKNKNLIKLLKRVKNKLFS
ncbi:MAG: glycosyltransferase family 2 protein [Polaribacter sp.]|uniref:glycosyltransferase family 2 protein n=1 Tax=Polaribacter sp. TaxID=1920175 RepID=UPI002F353228